MKAFLNRLHTRVGDLWWYSAMIFIACRSGDVIQAFIGLWLVPKYVGPNELGAVLPLQQLTSFLTVPLAILAVAFSKYVNSYATKGEYGKVKSLINDVFCISAILFGVCIVGAFFIMPYFYERLHIAAGSLTFLILICGLLTNIGTIVTSAQQGLKRFKTMTIMTLISAPIRLVTLLVTMPFRALSGYVLGQTTPCATTTILSIVDIHRTLKSYPPDKRWRKDIPEIGKYLLPIAFYTVLSTTNATISTTIYRQRLPEIESAANYILSRFAEIGGYVGCSLLVVLFPLASEAHERGEDNHVLLNKVFIPNIVIPFALALVFIFVANDIFTFNAEWQQYSKYSKLLPLLTITIGIASVSAAIVSYETACRRFTLPFIFVIYHFISTGIFTVLTGCEYFRGKLPDRFVDIIASLHFNNLETYSWYSFYTTTMLAVILYLSATSKIRRTHNTSRSH